MRRYETIYIARPGSGEKEIESITERTSEIITSKEGSIVRIDNWGLKKLAYPIKKEQSGYYVYIEYAGLPDAVSELERLFRIDDKVLKYLTVKTQEVFNHLPSDDEPTKFEQSEPVAEEAPVEKAEKPAPQETVTETPEESVAETSDESEDAVSESTDEVTEESAETAE